MKIKKNVHTKKFLKKLNCSPLSNTKKNLKTLKNTSCYTDLGLKKLANYWNIRHPDDKILHTEPQKIWKFFKFKFMKVCDNEKCWLHQKFIKTNNTELLKYFSPKAPNEWKQKPYKWLNSTDIEKILHQYEEAYDNFEFIGPSPIDFDKVLLDKKCVWNELCNFSLKDKIKNKINKIGIVFNTDPHYKSGQHWIALFIDIKNNFIFYFDSNGNKCPKEIQNFVKKVNEQAKELKIKFKYYDNYKIHHQNKDGQCGIYTLYFIIELLLENKKPKFFKTTRIKDETMRDYRLIYFN